MCVTVVPPQIEYNLKFSTPAETVRRLRNIFGKKAYKCDNVHLSLENKTIP
jgi:hypothetical protein